MWNFRERAQGDLLRIHLVRRWVNKGKKRRAGVLGPGPPYLVGLTSPKTLVVPVQLAPYGTIRVRLVVDVDVVSSGVLP
jgi:hypothetical protein